MQEAMLEEASASGRVTLARQALVERPDKERYPGPPGWRLGTGLTTLPCKKTKPLQKTQRWKPDCPYENDIDYETRI